MSRVRWADGCEKLLVPITSVQQHPRNPNNGDIDEIMQSIQVNGYNDPVVIQKSTRYILAGNHRYQALLGLGEEHIPIVTADLDDMAALRYMIAANRIAELARKDPGMLIDVLTDLQETDEGLMATGYNEDKLEDLLAEAAMDNDDIDIPEEHGYGVALNGIYQVVLSFDNASDRNECAADLYDKYGEEIVKVADI